MAWKRGGKSPILVPPWAVNRVSKELERSGHHFALMNSGPEIASVK